MLWRSYLIRIASAAKAKDMPQLLILLSFILLSSTILCFLEVVGSGYFEQSPPFRKQKPLQKPIIQKPIILVVGCTVIDPSHWWRTLLTLKTCWARVHVPIVGMIHQRNPP
jgi:hypothetical protein